MFSFGHPVKNNKINITPTDVKFFFLFIVFYLTTIKLFSPCFGIWYLLRKIYFIQGK